MIRERRYTIQTDKGAPTSASSYTQQQHEVLRNDYNHKERRKRETTSWTKISMEIVSVKKPSMGLNIGSVDYV